MTTAIQYPDLIRRALVNLESIRANVEPGCVHQKGLLEMFSTALNHLEQAGENATEWRIPRDQLDVDGAEFKAKIEAILMYFEIKKENTQIGFHK